MIRPLVAALALLGAAGPAVGQSFDGSGSSLPVFPAPSSGGNAFGGDPFDPNPAPPPIAPPVSIAPLDEQARDGSLSVAPPPRIIRVEPRPAAVPPAEAPAAAPPAAPEIVTEEIAPAEAAPEETAPEAIAEETPPPPSIEGIAPAPRPARQATADDTTTPQPLPQPLPSETAEAPDSGTVEEIISRIIVEPLGEPARAPAVLRVDQAEGALIRSLDKISGEVSDLSLGIGERAEIGRLSLSLEECRYPVDNPSGDAFAWLTIEAEGLSQPAFEGWMVASSPALSALNHPRYDVWVIRCNRSSG